MIKEFFHTHIPFWKSILVIIIIAVFEIILVFYFRESVYNYNISISVQGEEKITLQYGELPSLSNADFFNKVRNEFIVQKVNFIEADLSSMKLRIYENGIGIKEIPILAKGKEGSWWETPSGLYQINQKAKNLFSGFGKVYMPWSMQFQGNFFIHGWPYYPDGEPVSSSYSGGCIRLGTEDAKEIYDKVKIGTPVLVFERDFSKDDFKYKMNVPGVSAKSYLVADLKNNFVFTEKNPKEILPIASITKLITALVATEYINLDYKIDITKEMIIPTSKPRLKIGNQISAMNLLYPLLLESSNEAALALAQYLGQERFVVLMNKKAEALGMTNTKFVDPYGGGEDNISNTEDLFNLAKYLYNNRSFILKITSGQLKNSAYGPPIFSDLNNFNLFGNNPNFIGGKIGKTNEASETMLSVFEIETQGEKRPVAIIIIGSQDKIKEDTLIILDWIKKNYAN